MSYFDDNEDRIIYGSGLRRQENRDLRKRIDAARARDEATCKRCGAHPLNLRLNDSGNWSLFEKGRGEHNRNVPHQCNPVTPDDFEELDK